MPITSGVKNVLLSNCGYPNNGGTWMISGVQHIKISNSQFFKVINLISYYPKYVYFLPHITNILAIIWGLGVKLGLIYSLTANEVPFIRDRLLQDNVSIM